ncbi:MAG: hypothetical protein Q4G47_08325, partial [Lachnospiraceae bacterium]|nr:hypothetical protein [Lachnospiraceae bacterium]
PSVGEGRKMVKSVSGYLKDAGRAYLIPGFYWQSFVKLMGYRLGKSYRILPRGAVKYLSMNPDFFDSRAFSRFQHK